MPEGITPGAIARVLMDDEPLGFEEMAAKQAGDMTATDRPETVATAPTAQFDEQIKEQISEQGITHSLAARTLAEQEAGREAVARRQSEHLRNQAITARENAKRLEQGAAHPEDLAYNPGSK
jgi:hypothetical protein